VFSFPGKVRVRNTQAIRTGPRRLEMSDISTSFLGCKRKGLIAYKGQCASAHILEFIRTSAHSVYVQKPLL